MEPTLFQIGKQAIFAQKARYPPHVFHVTLPLIYSIDKNVIQINDEKDIKLFCQDLINIALDVGQNIR